MEAILMDIGESAKRLPVNLSKAKVPKDSPERNQQKGGK